MPRALRISYPGAVYHVITRGNNKQNVFADDSDRRYYLELLRETVKVFRLKMYAYALMSNHIHLLFRTLLPNVSDAMMKLNHDYSVRFNKRYDCTGHLFERRFTGKLVQTDRYFLSLLRYIHMNPVKAGMVRRPAEYAWSSHREYLPGAGRVITDPGEALGFVSDDSELAFVMYLDFIAKPIPDEEFAKLSSERNGILGDLSFRRSFKKGSRYLLAS